MNFRRVFTKVRFVCFGLRPRKYFYDPKWPFWLFLALFFGNFFNAKIARSQNKEIPITKTQKIRFRCRIFVNTLLKFVLGNFQTSGIAFQKALAFSVFSPFIKNRHFWRKSAAMESVSAKNSVFLKILLLEHMWTKFGP